MSSVAPSTDRNKQIARRLIEEAWSKGNLAILDELLSPTFTDHDPVTPDMGTGPNAVRKAIELYRAAFPDLSFTVEETLAEGDKVALRFTSRGTHKGELFGIRPTNRTVTVAGQIIAKLTNGKIVENWANWDALGMLRQLGANQLPK
jgi:steroid delta-isomerase-like uncharacterized protein